MITKTKDDYVKEWPYIPKNAFLYFPTVEQIRTGSQQKQWRKIFENGYPYTEFEERQLKKLQQLIKKRNAEIDVWFDKANKLRFLQANKFKYEATVDAMLEYTAWRKKSFPVIQTAQIREMLNSGAFYFSGRDNKYRPIIVANIGKIREQYVDFIPSTLVILMEFMINNFLIQGQVENYILIMNLEQFSFSMRGVVMKILSFTSNSYRGRLFVSYLLSMPGALRWGWEALASKFVSENTLKKIRVSGDKTNEEMWTHISKDTIERQYGGNLPNKNSQFWPPKQQVMMFVDRFSQQNNKLITKEQYNTFYKQGQLKNRKVLKQFLTQKSQLLDIRLNQSLNSIEEQEENHVRVVSSKISVKNRSKLPEAMLIKAQTSFIKKYVTINTFFQTQNFKKICIVHEN